MQCKIDHGSRNVLPRASYRGCYRVNEEAPRHGRRNTHGRHVTACVVELQRRALHLADARLLPGIGNELDFLPLETEAGVQSVTRQLFGLGETTRKRLAGMGLVIRRRNSRDLRKHQYFLRTRAARCSAALSLRQCNRSDREALPVQSPSDKRTVC